MYPLSYLSAKTVVRLSPIHGRGLFAREAIHKDEIVDGSYFFSYLLEKMRKQNPS
ncbi:MAG: hypothetical protein ACXWFY_06770 [Chthoniobacterales bacterium]